MQTIITMLLILAGIILTWKITLDIERRRIAEKMFGKARQFLKEGRPNAAYETFHFMRWELVDKRWFEEFLNMHKTITRELFCELNAQALSGIRNDHTKILSSEELAREAEQRISRIFE